MSFIGTIVLRLKFFSSLLGLGIILSIFPVSAFCLERSLTNDEIQKLEKNLKTNPQNTTAARFLIKHYSLEKSPARVVEIARPLQKDLPAAELILLSKAFLELQDGTSALSTVQFLLSKEPPTSELKQIEAQAMTLLANKESSEDIKKQKALAIIDVLKEAIRLDSKNKAAYFQWIDVLETFWVSSTEDVLLVYQLLEVATKDSTSYLNEKCELSVDATLWDQGLSICKQALSSGVAKENTYVFLAKAQEVKESKDESRKTLLQMVEKFPQSPLAHRTLGLSDFLTGNYIAAAEQLQKASELDPRDEEVFLKLADAQFQLKKYEPALHSYETHCRLSRTLASEFKHSTGELRKINYPLHNKYKKSMSSCQK